jgi:hypothetical protein
MKLVAIILLAGAGNAFGQTTAEPSLGELARQEKEKRLLRAQTPGRTGKTLAVKTYTQDDIKTTLASDEAEVTEPGKEPGSAASSQAAPDPAAEAAARQDAERQQWRGKADAALNELASAQREQSALELLAAGQTIPPNGLVIARDRVATAKQRLAQLEEDARRVGVPPAWVR